MRKAQFILLVYLLLCCHFVNRAQTARTAAPMDQSTVFGVESEIRDFFASYADDLRQHRREAIAGRYDPRGYFQMGNGSKVLVSLADAKNRYLTKWTGPKSFEWRDISVEVLSPEAAVVVALFDWQRQTGEKAAYSYTGLLVKHSGKWLIRVEDESGAPPKPPQQERKAITLDPAVLEKYAGQYQLAPNL